MDVCVFLPPQGYWCPRALIAAQTPLPDTIADFLLMVYQKRASTIIMLSDCSEGDQVPAEPGMHMQWYIMNVYYIWRVNVPVSSCSQESDCAYWGKDKKTFGDFEVEVVSTDITPTFICRDMLIRHVKVTQEPTTCSASTVCQHQLLWWWRDRSFWHHKLL